MSDAAIGKAAKTRPARILSLVNGRLALDRAKAAGRNRVALASEASELV